VAEAGVTPYKKITAAMAIANNILDTLIFMRTDLWSSCQDELRTGRELRQPIISSIRRLTNDESLLLQRRDGQHVKELNSPRSKGEVLSMFAEP